MISDTFGKIMSNFDNLDRILHQTQGVKQMSLHVIFYFSDHGPFSCIVEPGAQFDRFIKLYSTKETCIGWTVMKVVAAS